MKTVLAALLAVAAAAIVWQQIALKNLRSENARLREESATVPKLRAEVQKLAAVKTEQAELERLRPLQKEVVQLRGLVSEGLRAQTELAQIKTQALAGSIPGAAGAPVGAEGQTNQFSSLMAGAMKEAVEQQFLGKLDRMKTKLNLTADQEEQIKQILTKQAEQGLAMAQKMFGGKMSKSEMASNAAASNPEKEINALLTPEQQTAYKQMNEEEKTANARVMANSELLQMQTAVGLTQEQQDKVFPILYEQTLKQVNPDPKGMVGKSAEAMIQKQFDDKIKAMEGVLTPEQLENYRKTQERQLKLIKGFLPDISPPAKPAQ